MSVAGCTYHTIHDRVLRVLHRGVAGDGVHGVLCGCEVVRRRNWRVRGADKTVMYAVSLVLGKARGRLSHIPYSPGCCFLPSARSGPGCRLRFRWSAAGCTTGSTSGWKAQRGRDQGRPGG
jgi:hypothetical protein